MVYVFSGLFQGRRLRYVAKIANQVKRIYGG
jgi:hypothetical protein